MKRQLFFCFGPPKSGTTFLQRLLNLHPEISCPSEYSFDFLIRKLSDLLEEYDDILALIDRRTGGQGTTPMRKVLLPIVLQHTIENMILYSAGDKKIAGANDNSILNAISMYNNLFDSPKLIVIFRNPVDTAISAWHHNMRLAKEENNPEHEQLMTQYGGFEGWVINSARLFSKDVNAYLDFADTHDNIIMVRYEDLVHDKRATVTRLFTFLGASLREAILDDIMEKSSLSAMRATSSNKAFYRSGSTSAGKETISDELRKEIASKASDALQALNYRII